MAPEATADAAGWLLAAPSFVIPADLPQNCLFLEGRVDEVALCLFESAACLDYGEAELPGWLAELCGRSGPLRYHVHLPLDLPWEQGAGAVCEICAALARKTAFLSPHSFVLHPPGSAHLLQAFLEAWTAAGQQTSALCLENTRDDDLAESLPLTYAGHCGICLDLGHALAFGQQWLLTSQEVLDRVRLVHLYASQAAAGSHAHQPLTALPPGEQDELRRHVQHLGPGKGRTMLLELFDWRHFEASAKVAAQWL